MVNEGIVLGHKISERGIEVDQAKVDAIEKMPCPKDIKGICSFLGHAGFYRRFIKDHYCRMGQTRHYDQRPFDEAVCDAIIANAGVKNVKKAAKHLR